ncbi:hypothetical protein N7490_003192 [Penicillium lividum]|nr:hypothetical protein N7490_003192 [Penicillium lividum]
MKRHQGPKRPPETPQAQFKTPSRPTPRVSKSTTSKRTASPHILGSTNPRKRDSLSSSLAQSTLTQIDFVTQTTQPDDEALDYLEDSWPLPNTNDQPVLINEDIDDDPDHRSSLRSRPGHSTFGTDDDHPKRRRKSVGVNGRGSEQGNSVRKNQTPQSSVGPKKKRKSSEKPTTKRDKTLTQMDFVRRYIPIDDDDDNDMNMGYIQPTFQRNTPKDIKMIGRPNITDSESRPTPTSAKRNRRLPEVELDLSTGEPISDSGTSQAAGNSDILHDGAMVDGPVTPHKRNIEIPSSQSPESPGLAIITSSQFRTATHSTSKQKIRNFAYGNDNHIKEESPKSPLVVEDSQGQGHGSPEKTPTAGASQRPTFAERLASCAPSTESMATPRPTSNVQQSKRTERQRTVVYETDAETDQSGSEDNVNDDPTTPSRSHESQVHDALISNHIPWSPLVDDSQELPLPNVQSSDNQDDDPASEAPMSDASLYYQRMQPATQFPHGSIPSLNTQRLSELFPNEGSTQYVKSAPIPAAPSLSGQKFPGPFLQTQTQSQEGEEPEIVPESSPVRGQENSMEESQVVFQRPRVPESVQVESSQPVAQAHAERGKALSRSQLLTSSVMESVPLPNFWMGSQDSVGEPYS